ncbi:MAG TPA: phosphoserine transaminase [Candidatus Dormibacteraeota bacterium]|nr:phosphoserine transaminase [Candidatus Dormibacteraeota bacterium]
MSTVTAPTVVIPGELLPEDGRFGCGPSKVRPAAVTALAAAGRDLLGTSHRQPPVRELVGRLRSGLLQFFGAPEGYEVLLGIGGATSFWDAATFGLIERRSEHLVFGEFSQKFATAAAAAPHLEAPRVVESPPGTHPALVVDPDVDAYALTHNETSTGVVMPVARPRDGSGLVLVDATSAAAGVPVDLREADVYYFSLQKGFAAEGGLWVAICSPAAIERLERIGGGGRWVPASLDLRVALQNSRLNQTYNTPAISTLLLAVAQLEWMQERGGLQWACGRTADSAAVMYGWAEAAPYASPFVAAPEERSPVVATIDLDSRVPAGRVSEILRAHGIVDTDAYRKLGRNQLRIGLFPAVEPEDVRQLTRAIDHVVDRLGWVPTDAGAEAVTVLP